MFQPWQDVAGSDGLVLGQIYAETSWVKTGFSADETLTLQLNLRARGTELETAMYESFIYSFAFSKDAEEQSAEYITVTGITSGSTLTLTSIAGDTA